MDSGEPDMFLSGGLLGRTIRAAVRGLWIAARLPVVTVLVILEPVVRVLLAGFALLFVLVAFVLELTAPAALHVPFWGMLAMGIGCAWLLALYYLVLRVLSA
jgi:hypothetical protein